MSTEVLASDIDKSVNFIQTSPKGTFESRFVHRSDSEHFIAYLSSQTGCEQACRMCHLTATGQNKDVRNANRSDFIIQANNALSHYDSLGENSNVVHFNFMARGEPLLNPDVVYNSGDLFRLLSTMASDRNLKPEFLISTIMPQGGPSSLVKTFHGTYPKPRIYYSLYSGDSKFRKKWLPRAIDHNDALRQLIEYQSTNPTVRNKLHWSYIDGHNDNVDDIKKLGKKLQSLGFNGMGINVVRYNPYSAKYGAESDISTINECVAELQHSLPNSKIKIIPRVGTDVYASCGMFTE